MHFSRRIFLFAVALFSMIAAAESWRITVPTTMPASGKVIGATVKVFIHPSVRPDKKWSGWRQKVRKNLKAAFTLLNKSFTNKSFGSQKLLFTAFTIRYLPVGSIPSEGKFCSTQTLRDYMKTKGKVSGEEILGGYSVGLYITPCRGGVSVVGGQCGGSKFPVIGKRGLLNNRPEKLHRIMRHEFGHFFGAGHDGNPSTDNVKDDAGNICIRGQGPSFAPKPIMGGNRDDYWSTCSRDRIQRLLTERYAKCDRFKILRA